MDWMLSELNSTSNSMKMLYLLYNLTIIYTFTANDLDLKTVVSFAFKNVY